MKMNWHGGHILYASVLQFLLWINVDGSKDVEWHKSMSIYQANVENFAEPKDDSIILGIAEKVDYLSNLGINTFYLSPPFPSEREDFGFDVREYCDIDPKFGTLEDFKTLIRKMNEKGIRVMLDLIINHSGRDCEWFKQSVEGKSPYVNFYMWKNSAKLPNNWKSVFGGSAWEKHDTEPRYYLHQFKVSEPDFNLDNVDLRKEIKKIMFFWFDIGVDALRLNAVEAYYENPDLKDNPVNKDRFYLTHQPKTFDFLSVLREYVDEYNQEHSDGFEKVIISEIWHKDNEVLKTYYGKSADSPNGQDLFRIPPQKMPHYIFNGKLVCEYLNWYKPTPKEYHNVINDFINFLKSFNGFTIWTLETHDWKSCFYDKTAEINSIMLTVAAMLPGGMATLYGQEASIISEKMNWNQVNEYEASNEPNTLSYFKQLMEIRKKYRVLLRDGDYWSFHLDYIFGITREYEDDTLFIVCNFTKHCMNLINVSKSQEEPYYQVLARTPTAAVVYPIGEMFTFDPDDRLVVPEYGGIIFKAVMPMLTPKKKTVLQKFLSLIGRK